MGQKACLLNIQIHKKKSAVERVSFSSCFVEFLILWSLKGRGLRGCSKLEQLKCSEGFFKWGILEYLEKRTTGKTDFRRTSLVFFCSSFFFSGAGFFSWANKWMFNNQKNQISEFDILLAVVWWQELQNLEIKFKFVKNFLAHFNSNHASEHFEKRKARKHKNMVKSTLNFRITDFFSDQNSEVGKGGGQ